MNYPVNDFCPRVQLQKLIDGYGNPDIQVTFSGNEQIVRDKNDIWKKISDSLPEFISRYTGTDLQDVVIKEAKELYMRKLMKSSKQLAKLQARLSTEELFATVTGCLTMTICKSSMPEPLPWGGTILRRNVSMVNTCTVDNMLFILHMVQLARHDLSSYLEQSDVQELVILHKIHKLFVKGHHAEGKFMWLKQFKDFSNCTKIDAHGSEDEYFASRFHTILSTTYTSTCSQETCKQPVKLLTTRIISFRLVYYSIVQLI